MKLFKLLNTFSLDLTEEFFSLNDTSALNIEVLSAEKIAYSLIAKKNMRACVQKHKNLRITNNISISH